MLSFNLCFYKYISIGPILRSQISDLCCLLPLKSMGEPNVLCQSLSKPILGSTGQRSTRSTKLTKIDINYRHPIFTSNIDIKYCHSRWLPSIETKLPFWACIFFIILHNNYTSIDTNIRQYHLTVF